MATFYKVQVVVSTRQPHTQMYLFDILQPYTLKRRFTLACCGMVIVRSSTGLHLRTHAVSHAKTCTSCTRHAYTSIGSTYIHTVQSPSGLAAAAPGPAGRHSRRPMRGYPIQEGMRRLSAMQHLLRKSKARWHGAQRCEAVRGRRA